MLGEGLSTRWERTMLAYGIMAALVARERQGVGQAVEASMLGSAIHLQHDNFHMYLWKKRRNLWDIEPCVVGPVRKLVPVAPTASG